MDHDGMNEYAARHLLTTLEPSLPACGLSAVPWNSEDGEWIVTVWTKDENGENLDALIDIFERAPGYTCRTVDGSITTHSQNAAELPYTLFRTLRDHSKRVQTRRNGHPTVLQVETAEAGVTE